MAQHSDIGIGLTARLRQRIAVEVPPMAAPVSLAIRCAIRGSVILSRNSARTCSCSICWASRDTSAAEGSLLFVQP